MQLTSSRKSWRSNQKSMANEQGNWDGKDRRTWKFGKGDRGEDGEDQFSIFSGGFCYFLWGMHKFGGGDFVLSGPFAVRTLNSDANLQLRMVLDCFGRVGVFLRRDGGE